MAEQDTQDEELHAASRMKRHLPTVTGLSGLRDLEGVITRSAINRLKPEMQAARELNNLPIIILANQPPICPQKMRELHRFWSCMPSYDTAAEQFAARFKSLAQDLRQDFNTPTVRDSQDSPILEIVFVSPPKLSKRAIEIQQKAKARAKCRLPTAAELAELEVQKRKRTLSIHIPPSSAPISLSTSTSTGRPAKRQSLSSLKDTLKVPIISKLRKARSTGILNPRALVEELKGAGSGGAGETQDIYELELAWFKAIQGVDLTEGATQETAIDLCGLDTQEEQVVSRYTELRSSWQPKRAAQDIEEAVISIVMAP
ncbi:hypothetical protein BDD12DRAFT_810081 [Trichophaea hybrida]|nr:hypothetical protein BDD12DRAFT_810081 [Trichophaea hybrida]